MTKKKHNAQHLIVSPTAIHHHHHNPRLRVRDIPRRRRRILRRERARRTVTSGCSNPTSTQYSIARARRRRRSHRSRRRHTYRSLDRVLRLRKVPHVSRHGGDDTRVDVASRVTQRRCGSSSCGASSRLEPRNETNTEEKERRRG